METDRAIYDDHTYRPIQDEIHFYLTSHFTATGNT